VPQVQPPPPGTNFRSHHPPRTLGRRPGP
jgi:hypothetical protein